MGHPERQHQGASCRDRLLFGQWCRSVVSVKKVLLLNVTNHLLSLVLSNGAVPTISQCRDDLAAQKWYFMNNHIELEGRGMTLSHRGSYPDVADLNTTQAYVSSGAMAFCQVTPRCRPGFVITTRTPRSGPSEPRLNSTLGLYLLHSFFTSPLDLSLIIFVSTSSPPLLLPLLLVHFL